MKARLFIILVLVTSMLAGCTQTQQQKDIPQPSEPNEEVTAAPYETANTTENRTGQIKEESVGDVDNLESNISEVENLINDLEGTDEINFSI